LPSKWEVLDMTTKTLKIKTKINSNVITWLFPCTEVFFIFWSFSPSECLMLKLDALISKFHLYLFFLGMYLHQISLFTSSTCLQHVSPFQKEFYQRMRNKNKWNIIGLLKNYSYYTVMWKKIYISYFLKLLWSSL
jgi:hypothetical protein